MRGFQVKISNNGSSAGKLAGKFAGVFPGLFVGVFAGAIGLAGMGLAAADEIEYSIYHVSDHSNTTVSGTSFSLAKTLFQRTMVLLDIELDQVTVPPLDV